MGSTFTGTVVTTTTNVTAAEIAQVRRMTAEPTAVTYSDANIIAFIENFPLVDENGETPRIPSMLTPGEMMVNPDWMATYDLNAAAAAIWMDKAAILAQDYDYSADGANLSRSQAFEQAMKMMRFYQSRRSPTTITLVPDISRERTYEINA
jgi:hypothetical protein